MNYHFAKIYAITCLQTNLKYIGSTTKEYVMHRINQHVNAYASYLNGKADYCSSFEVISKGHFAVEILEEYPCDSKEEIKQREKHHIRNNTCVNKNIPSRTNKEYYTDNIEKFKEQYQRSKNNDYYKKKHECTCGGTYTINNMKQHYGTEKHLKKNNIYSIDITG